MSIEEDDLQQQFKVFRDPSFNDYVKIVGREFNPELPLFAQLYIVKQYMQFYTLVYNHSFVPMVGFNMAF